MSCCSDCKALASILDIGTTCRECGRGVIVQSAAPMPSLVGAYDLGRTAAIEHYGLDCNPWRDDYGNKNDDATDERRRAWDQGHANWAVES